MLCLLGLQIKKKIPIRIVSVTSTAGKKSSLVMVGKRKVYNEVALISKTRRKFDANFDQTCPSFLVVWAHSLVHSSWFSCSQAIEVLAVLWNTLQQSCTTRWTWNESWTRWCSPSDAIVIIGGPRLFARARRLLFEEWWFPNKKNTNLLSQCYY